MAMRRTECESLEIVVTSESARATQVTARARRSHTSHRTQVSAMRAGHTSQWRWWCSETVQLSGLWRSETVQVSGLWRSEKVQVSGALRQFRSLAFRSQWRSETVQVSGALRQLRYLWRSEIGEASAALRQFRSLALTAEPVGSTPRCLVYALELPRLLHVRSATPVTHCT
eukprot:2297896-Prymnesium_polylepis.1